MSELAASILRKMASNPQGGCIMTEGRLGLIDSGWTELTPDEIAYLDALWKEANA